jgi:hypothetical protein
MPDHISPALLVIALAINFLFRFVLLTVFLLIMIKIQKLEFTWLPLIGSALLASALDMIPLVGHFIAVPVLYLCIWKIAKCEIFPDAVFTVGLSYALTRALSLIVLAYAPMPHLPPRTEANYDFYTNSPTVAMVQPTNVTETESTPEPAPSAPDNPPASAPQNNLATTGISLVGVSGEGNGAIVTIKYGQKDYSISADEGVTLATDSGVVPVRLLGADEKQVTLDIDGQTQNYPVK